MTFTSLRRIGQRIKATGGSANIRHSKFRRTLRRNRTLVIALLAVGGLVALLTGIGMAQGDWKLHVATDPNHQPPPARFGAATTSDVANDEVLIFGGFISSGTSFIADDHTYAAKWSSAQGGNVPASNAWINRTEAAINAPSPRGYASMAYDGARKNVVLFGGGLTYRTNSVSGETWTWDGKNWTLQNPPEPRPEPRQNAVMVYDAHPDRKVVVLFGGRGANGKPMNDTWTWNGSAWKIMPSAGAPSPRHSAAMAYDVCRAEAVMFGGLGYPIEREAGRLFVPEASQTWTWDGAKWTPQTAQLSPPARIGASMSYSDVSGRVLLYGGLTTTDTGHPAVATDTDIWRWDAASATGWGKMNSEASSVASHSITLGLLIAEAAFGVPPPRAYASFAAQPSQSGRFLLFGGTPADASAVRIVGAVDNLLDRVPQVAFPDVFGFHEHGQLGRTDGTLSFAGFSIPSNPITEGVLTPDGLDSSGHPRYKTPLTHKCENPVPIPSDEAVGSEIAQGPEVPRVETREGMREIDQLPVLTGTDWPLNRRNPRIGTGQNAPANPNYTPPPDCPNRGGNPSEDGSNTQLRTDQKRNRVYQFFICDSNRGDTSQGGLLPKFKLLIGAYHGSTLEPLGRVVIVASVGDRNFDLGHDVDRGHFLVRSSWYDSSSNTGINELLVLSQDQIEKGDDPIVQKIDLAGAPNLNLRSFFNHPKTGKPKLFSGLTQWDLEKKSPDWTAALTGSGCDSASALMRSGNNVYGSCTTGNKGGVVKIPITENENGSETPGTAQGFLLPQAAGVDWWDPQEERMLLRASPYPAGLSIWVFDGKASRYVGLSTVSNQSQSDTNVVPRFGFDQETGRLYVHTKDWQTRFVGKQLKDQGGLQQLDTRLTPVSQPLKFPQFSSPPGTNIASLPPGPGVPRRIFIRQAGGQMKKYPDGEDLNVPNEMFYRVVADEIPIPEKPEIAQLDALTVPVAETPGKTEVTFDAEGSGYGIRLLSVGGIWSTLRPFPQAWDSDIGPLVEGIVVQENRYLFPACLFPDRELMAGWVPGARLSDLDAGARSSGLEVDSNSKTDLVGPFSRCNPTLQRSDLPPSGNIVYNELWPLWDLAQFEANKAASTGVVEQGKDADGTTQSTDISLGDISLGTLEQGKDSEGNPTSKFQSSLGTSWDHFFKEVECVGDALKTYQATVGNIYGSANCVQREGHVEATARGSAPGVGPAGEAASGAGFSVSEGYSNVSVKRDPEKGVVVTSTAVAKGIQIPGLNIGLVETKAVTWSNGRPGEERASFTRKICGVITPDYSNGRCLSSGEQQQFVDGWNNGWKVNSKMYLPTPDPDLYKGSPGGYIAGVVKQVGAEFEDRIISKDSQKEVPGLVIDFYKNSVSQGFARQSLQLAATRAIAGFGVQCNPDYIYSPQAKDCVAIPDDLLEEEFFEEEEEFFEDEESELDGEWTEVEAIVDSGESLGTKIGKLLEQLPILSGVPVREIAEALLLGSVWVLLGLPMLLAYRRLSLYPTRRS